MSTKTNVPISLSQRAARATLPPISDLMSRAISNPELISLAAGFVDEATLPVEPLRTAFEALWSEPAAPRASLQYGKTQGDQRLRELLQARLARQDGKSYNDIPVDQFVLTAGSNQLLHLTTDTLIDAGDMVICAAPTYFVFMGLLQDLGGIAYGVEMDDCGMVPESLEAALKEIAADGNLHRVKAIYLVSYFDNPRALNTSVERRKRIVEIAKRWSTEHRIYVFEDAAYRDLRFAGDDTPSTFSFDEEHDTVIHFGTFSKSFAPGVRVGWGVFPEELLTTILNLKGNFDFGSPHLNQRLVATMIEQNLFDPHIEQLCTNYARKAKAMTDAMDEHLSGLPGVSWSEPAGGLYVWLTLPEHIAAGADGQLFDLAVNKGMLYVPGEFCYPTAGVGVRKNTIRLSFGVQDSPRIERGIELLAEAISELI